MCVCVCVCWSKLCSPKSYVLFSFSERWQWSGLSRMCWTTRLACRPLLPQRPERWCSGADRGATRHLIPNPNARMTMSLLRTFSHRLTMSLVSFCVRLGTLLLQGHNLLQLGFAISLSTLFCFQQLRMNQYFAFSVPGCAECGCSASTVTSWSSYLFAVHQCVRAASAQPLCFCSTMLFTGSSH